MEYRFRAWDAKQKYMAYQGAPDLETIQSFMHHFGDCKLMISTGRTDSDDKEIYDGDYLEIVRDGKARIGRVRFINGDTYVTMKPWATTSLFHILAQLILCEIQSVRVVGNECETPEIFNTAKP